MTKTKQKNMEIGLDETQVDRPIWWHWLIIIVPEKISHKDFATVIGTGGMCFFFILHLCPRIMTKTFVFWNAKTTDALFVFQF